MPPSRAFGEPEQDASDLEDPFDWNVDQVVNSLCSPSSTILRWGGGVYLPDPEGFAKVLREEQINGEALLTTVTMEILRVDLGIKALGARSKIVNLIGKLQHQSSKYQQTLERAAARESRLSSVASMSQYYTPTFTSPQHSGLSPQTLAPRLSYYQPSLRIESGPTLLSPKSLVSATEAIPTAEISTETPFQPAINEDTSSSANFPSKQYESSFIDQDGRRRRRLAPTFVTETSSKVNPPKSPDQAQNRHLPEPQIGLQDIFEDFGFQKTLETPRLSPENDEFLDKTPSGADQHVNNVATLDPVPKSPKTKEDFLDLPHRRRIKPILIGEATKTQSREMSPTQTMSRDCEHAVVSSKKFQSSKGSAPGRKSKRAFDQIYYGPSAFHVDDIFYSDIALGEITPAEARPLTTKEQEIAFDSTGKSSNAHRLWVNSKMKYFFQRAADTHLMIDTKHREVGVIPYPNRVVPKGHPLSMTVLSHNANGISKTRTNRLVWIAKAFPTEASTIFNVSDSSVAMDFNDRNWDYLEKWKYIEGDEVLPTYGDSDSGEDYDPQTWAEMEAEKRKPKMPAGSSSRAPKLNPEQVEAAVDEAIGLICEEWQVKQRPKIQHKAWRIWNKARRERTTDAQIEHVVQRLAALNSRLLNLKAEIGKEEWFSVSQIIRQSKSLQLSLFESEECQWKLAVLKSESAPEKLPASGRNSLKTKKSDKQPLQQSGENVTFTGSSADDEESSDDSMDDFIVHDELDGGEDRSLIKGDDQDLIMADDNDHVINSDTLANLPRGDSVHKKDEYHRKPAATTNSTTAGTEHKPKPVPDVVDLTQASDPLEPPPQKEPPERIVTPPIFQEDEDSDAWFARARSVKAEFRPPPKIEDIPTTNNSDEDSSLEFYSTPVPVNLPPLNDVQAIKRLNPTELVEKQDRRRLLLWLVARSKEKVRDWIFDYAVHQEMETCLGQIKNGLRELKAGRLSIAKKDQATSDAIMQLVAWYVGWTIPVKLNKKGISKAHIETTLESDDGFDTFYEFLLECLRLCKQATMSSMSPSSKPNKKRKAENEDLSDSALMKDKSNKEQFKKKKVDTTSAKSAPDKGAKDEEAEGKEGEDDDDDDLSDSAALAHVRNAVQGSQETLQKRDAALQRMHEDSQRVEQRALREARRRELMPRLDALAALQTEASEVILNPGKLNDRDLIRLNPEFGRGAQLKPHQKEGLQFMWREITGDHKDLQGCLLAQTMGLGKTIQVIALLVAISDAAKSPIENIHSQVPPGLHNSQTLVLCPPGLIENWWDEFLMWPPLSNHLGELRKISTSFALGERISGIMAWEREGGILLMGYHTFRDLIHNRARRSKSDKATGAIGLSPLSEEQHRRIKSTLLEKPNIVVADEAHEFKNLQSDISKAINQIKCKSRIALTGSPLSNNLGEYFATIDWISPSYLGTESDFTNAYARPIHDGLKEDAKPAQYRESRKRLKALELELEPKIHRADLKALHGNLHGKYDIIIRVPLTTFQARLYRDVLSGANVLSDDPTSHRTAKVWSYLATLQLICNHPGSEQAQPQKASDTPSSTDSPANGNRKSRTTRKQAQPGEKNNQNFLDIPKSDEDPTLDESILEPILSTALKKSREEFKALGGDIDALELSNKMQVLMKIIELSGTVGDKVLVFSHRHATLDYVEKQLRKLEKNFARIDGKTQTPKRQQISKSFNEGSVGVCLISTRAGGQGLNMFGANRVVILDSQFNPMWEQQAVGRAYRIGQQKPVFIYRLMAAGTFEDEMQKQGLYKEQLVTRVLEKRNPHRIGSNSARQYLFAPKEVKREDIAGFVGEDPSVLDHLLIDGERTPIVSITRFDTFYIDDGQELTAQEFKEAQQMLQDEQLRRRDPAQYYAKIYSSSAGRNAATSAGTSYPNRYPMPSHMNAPGPSSQGRPTNPPKHHLPKMPSGTPNNQPSVNVMDFGGLGPFDQRPWHAHGVSRADGGPIVSAPGPTSTKPKNVEAQLLPTVLNLFSSQRLLLRSQRTPHSTRIAARTEIYRITKPQLSRGPAWEFAEKLRNLIDKHAKSEKHFLNICEAVGKILERKDVKPDTLFSLMKSKLEKPEVQDRKAASQSSGNHASKRSEGRGLKASDPIEIDESTESNDGKLGTAGSKAGLANGDQQGTTAVPKDELVVKAEASEKSRQNPVVLDAPVPDQGNKENTPAVIEVDFQAKAKTNEVTEPSEATSKPKSTQPSDNLPTTVLTLEPQQETQKGKRPLNKEADEGNSNKKQKSTNLLASSEQEAVKTSQEGGA